MATSSEVKRRYNNKAYDHMVAYIPKGNKSLLQKYAKDHNTTVNKIINEYLRELLGVSVPEWKTYNISDQ